MTFDLVVKNGKIYTPSGFINGNIAINAGKIVALNKGGLM